MRGPGELFWRLLPAVRATERSRTLFFAALLTLISAGQTMGLAGSEALLLARLGVERLPEIFVAASLVTVAGSFGYAALVGMARNDRLLIWMLVGSALLLCGGAWLAWEGRLVVLVLPALFCFYYLAQAVFLNHFFTFSGDYFDTLTSKRLFPVFVVGGSVGGALGGAAAVLLTRTLGAESLLACWGGTLLLAALLLRSARGPLRRWGPLELEEADETSVEGMRGATRFLRASRLGRWLVLSALGMVVAVFIAQYLYSGIFAAAFPEPAELAAFFGAYLAITNLVEIALELWVTPWLIRRFGVPTAQLVHPLLTLLAFGGLLLRFGLASGIGARVVRELLENAMAQPLRALVYNALPQRLRGRIRAFLEGIVVYAGMSLAGVLLLVVGVPDPRWLAVAGAGAALLYLVANLRVRSAYLDELVLGIREGRLDFGVSSEELQALEPAQLEALATQLLREETARPSRSLLRLLPTLAARGVTGPLVTGLAHPHARVRTTCLHELSRLPDGQRPDAAIVASLRDPDGGVRVAALRALGRGGAPALVEQIAALQDDPVPQVRAAAAAELGEAGLPVLRAMLAGEAVEVAAALEVAPRELAAEVVAHCGDPRASVRSRALTRTAEVATHVPLPEAALLDALGADAATVRGAAVRLVAAALPERLDAVAERLADPAVRVRQAATAALSELGERGAAAATRWLRDGSETAVVAALEVIDATARAGERQQLLRDELRHRVRSVWWCLLTYQNLPPQDGVAPEFLRTAFEDALLRHRRLAFRVLALLEGERVVQKVEAALRSGTQRTRGDALEVLSHLGDRESSALLVLLHESAPLLDRRAPADAVVNAPTALREILLEASRTESRWLRAAAAAIDPALGHTPLEIGIMERLLALKQVPLFANLTLDQLEAVHQLATEATFVAGEVVMREGDAGSELYLLLEGRLEVWLGFETPEAQRLGEIRAVDYVGEMAILDDEPRSATIVAAEPSRMLSLAGESLKDLVREMPEISFEIFRVLTGRVRVAERRLRES